MIKQMRASYFHNLKNAQYCALSDDPIPDYLENGDEVYIIDKGKIYYWDASSSSLYEYKGDNSGSGGSSSFIPCFGSLATVQLGTTWSGNDPYTSTVTVTGYTVTNQTMVSVLPSDDVIEQMLADGITNIFITNNDGVLTATAIGATPTVPMTLQVLCTESNISGDIAELPSIVGSGIIETVEADNLTDAINILGEDVDDLKNAIDQKQDAPSTAGTAGQVLGLNNSLQPVWVNQSGGGGDVSNCAPIIINTASGDVASFADGANNRQIRKIVGTIVTPEGGSGWTGCKFYGRKANIATFGELLPRYGTSSSGVNLTVSNGKITFSGTATAGGAKFFGSFPTYAQRVFPVKAGVTYCASSKNTGNVWIQGNITYDDGTTSSGWLQVDATSGERKYRVFTPSKNGRIAFLPVANLTSGQEFSATIEDIQLTPEITAVYKGEAENIILPINWQDAAGTILNGSVTLNEDESADVVNSDTGNSYHLTNVGSLNTYFGENNVWIDTGSISECDYPADTKLYIDGLTEPDEDMIADGLIASGKYFTVNNQLYLSTAQIAAGAQIIPGSNCTATNIVEALNALNT